MLGGEFEVDGVRIVGEGFLEAVEDKVVPLYGEGVARVYQGPVVEGFV